MKAKIGRDARGRLVVQGVFPVVDVTCPFCGMRVSHTDSTKEVRDPITGEWEKVHVMCWMEADDGKEGGI